ncbi:hypothetical protein K501DRAFT_266359 [Backusella circina FSU 941]|nr:hypothetical protein K501DRAFT_266359 [Backusella circina FSU 941]
MRLMKKLQEESEQAAKVERLVLDLELHDLHSNILPYILPNLRQFLDCSNFNLGLIPSIDFPPYRWSGYIEQFCECIGTIYVTRLLESGVCAKLQMNNLETLANSGQTEYIQSLKFRNIELFHSFDLLAQFRTLSKLDIRYRSTEESEGFINLKDFFKHDSIAIRDLKSSHSSSPLGI